MYVHVVHYMHNKDANCNVEVFIIHDLAKPTLSSLVPRPSSGFEEFIDPDPNCTVYSKIQHVLLSQQVHTSDILP